MWNQPYNQFQNENQEEELMYAQQLQNEQLMYNTQMANQMAYATVNQGLFVPNSYGEQKFQKDLEKYNNRLVAKMNNLQVVPKVTTAKVKEALQYVIMQETPHHSPLKFVQLEAIPQNNLWRHACYYTGLIGGTCYTTMVYTTEVYFIYCPCCYTVHFYYEKKAEDEFYSL